VAIRSYSAGARQNYSGRDLLPQLLISRVSSAVTTRQPSLTGSLLSLSTGKQAEPRQKISGDEYKQTKAREAEDGGGIGEPHANSCGDPSRQ
jgi:hypothetical protein